VSRETLRRVLHRLGFRWRRPRPVPPEKDSEEQREQKRSRLKGILLMAEKAGSFFQDETRLETNPKVVFFCCMRKGKQRPLRTPGKNRKVWGSPERSTSKQDASIGLGGTARMGSCSSSCSTSCAKPTAATKNCIWPQIMMAVIPADGSISTCRIQEEGAFIFAPTAFSWSPEREQPGGGVGVVGFARGGCEPQPRVRGSG
jgi:hypothetical protein